jgi:asparagine synthase (glutamine-hydrolysing)
MSGIVGVCHWDGRAVDSAVLVDMLDTLAHRGSDGRSVWCSGPVGLGHRLMRSTPEAAHESLPDAVTFPDLVITADARIDNRDELLAVLEVPRVTDRPITDSQLILAAYQRWGTACASRLTGDFAFAVWDARNRWFYCARDHAGVRPLYYHRVRHGPFVFASEIKAIFRMADVPRRLNESRVADYLISAYRAPEETFYLDVSRLPAGHWMVVDQDVCRVEQFWAPDASREIRYRSDEAYAEAFLEIFTEAVRCRLRGPGPVAAMLSGGLDSSSIVGVARDLLRVDGRAPLNTFSSVFDELPTCDESRYIRAVLSAGGCVPHLVSFDHASHTPVSEMRSVVKDHDEPVFIPNAAQPRQLLSRIRDANVRVVLDGHGGDEIVSHGHGYLKELARAHSWVKLVRELQGVARSGKGSLLTLLPSYVAFGLAPAIGERPIRVAKRLWRAGRSRDQTRPSHAVVSPLDVVDAGLARRTNLADRYRAMRREASSFHSERQEHWKTVSRGSQPAALQALNTEGNAYSLELRFPFWDRRLVEFCLGLPAEQKRSGGWGRMILRRSMAGILPREVQWRPHKTDFTPSILQGLRRNEAAELDRLSRGADLLDGLANPATFRELCARAKRGQSRAREYHALSRLSTLYYWMEIGNAGSAP